MVFKSKKAQVAIKMWIKTGVVRQAKPVIKVKSQKLAKRRFGATECERHRVFVCKSICFKDAFHDWSGVIYACDT